jgi:hypothetical protein
MTNEDLFDLSEEISQLSTLIYKDFVNRKSEEMFCVRWERNRLGVMFDEEGLGFTILSEALQAAGLGSLQFTTSAFEAPRRPACSDLGVPANFDQVLVLQGFRGEHSTSVTINSLVTGLLRLRRLVAVPRRELYFNRRNDKKQVLTSLLLCDPVKKNDDGELLPSVFLYHPERIGDHGPWIGMGTSFIKADHLTGMFPSADYQPPERYWGRSTPSLRNLR